MLVILFVFMHIGVLIIISSIGQFRYFLLLSMEKVIIRGIGQFLIISTAKKGETSGEVLQPVDGTETLMLSTTLICKSLKAWDNFDFYVCGGLRGLNYVVSTYPWIPQCLSLLYMDFL